MTVEECIKNNIPIWRVKLEGWRKEWTKNNNSDKIKDEIFYIVNNSICKSDINDFNHVLGNFVMFIDEMNGPLHKRFFLEDIDEKETIISLFNFYDRLYG